VRVGVPDQEYRIDIAAAPEQAMDDNQNEQSIGVGRDRDELVGDRRIAGAHGIDCDDLGAALLQPTEAKLDRI
jgi:hypothetical protein